MVDRPETAVEQPQSHSTHVADKVAMSSATLAQCDGDLGTLLAGGVVCLLPLQAPWRAPLLLGLSIAIGGPRLIRLCIAATGSLPALLLAVSLDAARLSITGLLLTPQPIL